MRAALALVLLAAAVRPAAAEPPPDHMNWFGGPVAPHLFAWDKDLRGYARWPHDPTHDIKNGAGAVWVNKIGRHFAEGSRQGTHLVSALRFEDRLGVAFDWSQYQSGAFKSIRRSDLVHLHATADLSSVNERLLEYGLGLSSLWGDRTHFGISAMLGAELLLRRPWSLNLRYTPAILAHTSLLHDFQAGLGVNWKALGVEAGYRGIVNGLRHVYGPEASLRLSF